LVEYLEAMILSQRIIELDALRGIMALTVAVFHFQAPNHFFHGALAVDFFFILSGYMLAKQYFFKERLGFSQFAIIRFSRLYPMHLFGLMILLFLFLIKIVVNIYNGASVGEALGWHFPPDYYKDGVIFSLVQHLLLLNNVGLNPSATYWNGPSWSISVELWVNYIYFLHFRFIRAASLMLLVLFCYILIFNFSKTIDVHHQNIFNFVNLGLIRGFAGVCIGVTIYRLMINKDRLRIKFFSLIPFIQMIFLMFIYYCMHMWTDGPNSFAAIPFIAALICSICIFDGGWLVECLRNHWLGFLGKISYSIYLVHYPIQYFYQDIVRDVVGGQSVIIYVFTVILLSAVTYEAVEVRAGKWIRNILEKLFIKKGFYA
jgi:peptidoglycan/LPS O-acetylase OafA/YrhL